MREPLFDEHGKAKNREDLLSVGVIAGGKTRVTKLSESEHAVTERHVHPDGKSEVHVTLAPVDIKGER